MADYLTTEELDFFQLNAADISPEKKAFIITAASRYFDRLCEVEEDFFKQAEEEASEKVIVGNGLNLLQLPPFVGVLGDVIVNEQIIDSSYFISKGTVPNQYLQVLQWERDFFGYETSSFNNFRRIPFWSENYFYTISARWGWAEIPYDVKAAVAEIAISLSSGLDVAKALTLEESFAKLPMIVPNGFADRASRYYRERLAPIGI